MAALPSRNEKFYRNACSGELLAYGLMLCCCVCNWSAIQTMVAKLLFSLPVHLPCLSIVINVAPPIAVLFFTLRSRITDPVRPSLHVSTVDLLFVAISVFIRNHPVSLSVCGLPSETMVRPSLVASHSSNRNRRSGQKSAYRQNNCGSLFHHLLLKAINKS